MSHPFSLRQLEYAVAVADTLSFRRAAEQCHVSQPSLSAQLIQMEEALGIRLFERDRRRVLVTSAGHDLLERMRGVLQQAGDLAEAAKRAGDPFDGSLRIGVIPTISPYLIPRIAPWLRRLYPRLTLLWTEERTEVLRQKLDAGQLDAAIVAREADLGDVEQDVLLRDPFVLAASRSHPLAKSAQPARAHDLQEENVLLLDDGHCFREQALAFCARAKARELEFRATSLSTLAQIVAGGAGVTLLPEMAVEVEAERAGLRVRRFADPQPHRTIVLVWRKRSPLREPLREVAMNVRSFLKKEKPVPLRQRKAEPARRPLHRRT
ncbi:MAG TPA: LysR substrate-binding domain-containing protein [Thermoanaerobaculia bacterium]|nr:LysR substrate-binding domain-containing protein [Thermoanaerobaculia bacterium]